MIYLAGKPVAEILVHNSGHYIAVLADGNRLAARKEEFGSDAGCPADEISDQLKKVREL